MNLDKVSRDQAWVSPGGSPLTWNPWVGVKGPTQRRQMIDTLIIEADYDVTVATAVMQGENVPWLFANVIVEQHGHTRWKLPGDGSRAMSQKLLGPARFEEHADIGIGANATGTARMVIPLAKPLEHNPKDWALPAELFQKLTLTTPTSAQLSFGSSAVTINSVTYRVRAECREESKLKFHAVDEIGEVQMQSTSQIDLDLGVCLPAEILAYKPGDALTDMSNWTSHKISELQPDDEAYGVKKAAYVRRVGAAHNGTTPGGELYNDPIITDKVRVVYEAGRNATPPKIPDHPYVDAAMRIDATNTETDVKLLYRVIVPKKAAVIGRALGIHKKGANAANNLVIAGTKGKGDPKAFGLYAQFMPMELG